MIGYIEGTPWVLPNHISMQLYIEVVLPNFLTLYESREVGVTSKAVRYWNKAIRLTQGNSRLTPVRTTYN